MEQFGDLPQGVMEVLRSKGAHGPIAVVGASADPNKYGNIIVKNLLAKGYRVVPINPRGEAVEGQPTFRTVPEVPGGVGLVNFVVPPPVTLKVLQQLADEPVNAVWFQDGSFDDSVLAYARAHFEDVVAHACIMVVTNYPL